mmetsp:Transcript_2133/g.4825  ORF Transcript_2133/g.4825 Transcript_2133/m.4825 type:complete len:312 (-) Transcript_2133:657-1592(-)
MIAMQLPDQDQQGSCLLLEVLPVSQALPLHKQIVELGRGDCVLDIDRHNHIEEPKGHQHLEKAVDSTVPPAVGRSDHNKDGFPVLLGALARHNAPEHREEGRDQVGETLCALLPFSAESLFQQERDGIERYEDENHGVQKGLATSNSAVQHHQQVAEHLQPQDTQELRQSKQAKNPEQRGLRGALSLSWAQGDGHLDPRECDKQQFEVVPSPINSRCVAAETEYRHLQHKLQRENPCKRDVHNNPSSMCGVEFTAEAKRYGVEHNDHAHDTLHRALLEGPVLAETCTALKRLQVQAAAPISEELTASLVDD